jgi:DNA-binding GntR family transcriptional regulator
MDISLRIPPLPLDRSRQAVPQVADALRELILALELPPGTVLPRVELAQRFAVSQTPVREALSRLGEEGLVDIFPQHATIVSCIDVQAARQTHFLRRSLELEIVRELAGRPTGDVEALVGVLQARLDEQLSALQQHDLGAFNRADHAFHRAMYEAAGMSELWLLVRQRSGHVDRLRRLHLPEAGKAESVVADHQAITQALRARDPAAAQAALRAHLSGTLGFVDQVRAQHPQWLVG